MIGWGSRQHVGIQCRKAPELDAVFAQELVPEAYVTDDGSTDDTRDPKIIADPCQHSAD